jgi:hypothetical protein
MLNPQTFEVFCPDRRCGDEHWSSTGQFPIKSRRHRRMSYIGSRRVGPVSLAFRSIFDSGNPLEMGTYHFYACPVCGQEAAYLEKRGMMRPVVIDIT